MNEWQHYQRRLYQACFREAAWEGKEAAAQRGLDEGYRLGFLDGFLLKAKQEVELQTPEQVEQRIQELAPLIPSVSFI